MLLKFIKISPRNINNLRYANDTNLMAESKEIKSLWMKMKEEREKFGLKLNTQKTNIITSLHGITSWQIDGEKMETVTDFILGGFKIKSLQMVTPVMKLKEACSLEEKL